MAWYNPTDPTQQKFMIGGVVALLILVPFQMYYLAPGNEANAEVQLRVDALEEQNRTAEIIALRGSEELEQRLEEYETHVAALEELIPAREEVADLINSINSGARTYGVEVVSLDPEPAEQLQYYDRNSYSMAVVGEYHDVGRFLTGVANLSRIVTPVQVDVQLYATPQQYPDMQFPVLATFRVETYVLPDRSAQPTTEVEGGNS